MGGRKRINQQRVAEILLGGFLVLSPGCVDDDALKGAVRGTVPEGDAGVSFGSWSKGCDGFEDLDCEADCVLRVDASVSLPGQGRTWVEAHAEVQQGLDHAACLVDRCGAPCQVWVAAGTYYVYRGATDDAVRLRSDVALHGGFAGDETSMDQRDPVRHTTILDGRGEVGGTSQVYHVVIAADRSELSGFTVTGGMAEGEDRRDRTGGGLLQEGGSMTLADCVFTGNGAYGGTRSGYGGAIFSDHGLLDIRDCVFSDNGEHENRPTAEGGAICTDSGSLTVTGSRFEGQDVAGAIEVRGSDLLVEDCLFRGNRAEQGGAISVGGNSHMESGSVVIRDTEFEGNQAQLHGASDGGAIFVYLGEPVLIEGCTFTANAAMHGGALMLGGGDHVVRDCEFTDNRAEDRGGAVAVFEGNAILSDCRFIGNNADIGGGAFFKWSNASPRLESCTFSGNWSRDGGAIQGDDSGTLELVNGTLTSNLANGQGGALYMVRGASFVVLNSILWGNAPFEIFTDDQGGADEISYSDILGGWNGIGNLDVDPLLADPVNEDFSLLPGSPCIDAADGAVAPEQDSTGNSRQDDPDVTNTGQGPPWADIGAYEGTGTIG